MEPVVQDLEHWVGDPFDFAATWKQDGSLVDLTGWEIDLYITSREETPQEFVHLVLAGNTEGQMSGHVDAADLPTRGKWAWRLEITQPDAEEADFLVVGSFEMKDTRDV